MDPLTPLYELFDEMRVQPKPQFRDEEPPMETPPSFSAEHPVTQQRKEVDNHRESGVNPEDAHQAVHGDVDTGDVESKAKFAATLSRVQGEKDRKGVRVDKDGESLLAKDEKIDDMKPVTKDDLRTPQDQQVPVRDQAKLDAQEEYDYNEDVRYLQKYGRA
tara:strand:+ start:694 stop:1176 length:483 start_codon:yes stop_codon:yes gene_type:complete